MFNLRLVSDLLHRRCNWIIHRWKQRSSFFQVEFWFEKERSDHFNSLSSSLSPTHNKHSASGTGFPKAWSACYSVRHGDPRWCTRIYHIQSSNKTMSQDRDQIPFLVPFQFFCLYQEKSLMLVCGGLEYLPKLFKPSLQGRGRPQVQSSGEASVYLEFIFTVAFYLSQIIITLPLIIVL